MTIGVEMANFTIKRSAVEENAIYHDREAFIWFKMWQRDESNCTYRAWQEHNAKRDAMLELLDMMENGSHVVFNDVVTTIEELKLQA